MICWSEHFLWTPQTGVYGLFFITENTVSGMAYQAMLESGCCSNSWGGEEVNFLAIYSSITTLLSFSHENIYAWAAALKLDVRSLAWPPSSPDLWTVNFIFWGSVRDNCYTSPFPQSQAELFGHVLVVTVAIETAVTQHVWEELQYYLDHGYPTCSPQAVYGHQFASGRPWPHL